VRSNILDEKPDAKVAVYAVWLPMLAGEERSDWDGGPLVERRVAHFWDGDRILGRWLADRETGDLGRPGGVVWDAYLLFGPDARWQDEPTGLRAAGAPIIGETGELNDAATAVLAAG
jgi:hypothetical protein